MCIHSSCTDRSILNTDRHNITDLLSSLCSVVAQVLDIDARVRLFMEFKSIFWVFGQKIANFLVVNFEI
jgi:hypothetical protein